MADGLHDFFGDHPDRPDVPEFWHLSEIVLRHDADADESEDLTRIIEETIPEPVASYVAVQRSAAMLMEHPLFMLMRMLDPHQFLHIHILSTASWIDGFCAGAAYQKKYNTPKVPVAECHPDCGPITKAYYGRHVHENCDGTCSHTNEPEMR